MDGHNNFMIVNLIVYCMKHVIDLFILFLHTSYLLQPFNVGVFVPLKCALIEKTNAVFRYDFGHIS